MFFLLPQLSLVLISRLGLALRALFDDHWQVGVVGKLNVANLIPPHRQEFVAVRMWMLLLVGRLRIVVVEGFVGNGSVGQRQAHGRVAGCEDAAINSSVLELYRKFVADKVAKQVSQRAIGGGAVMV